RSHPIDLRGARGNCLRNNLDHEQLIFARQFHDRIHLAAQTEEVDRYDEPNDLTLTSHIHPVGPRQFFSKNDRIPFGEILNVAGSISTKIGVAPTRAIQAAVAKNEYGVVMMASPGPISSAIKTARSASVPEETPIAKSAPVYWQRAPSNCSTLGPRMNRWLSSTSSSCCRIGPASARYCSLRSRSGTRMARQNRSSVSRFNCQACLCQPIVDRAPALL